MTFMNFPLRQTFLNFVCLALIFCAGAIVAFAQAQSNAGDLNGVVTDSNGATVAGANVTARNAAINVSRSAVSDDVGEYKITSLPPGEYEVSIEAATFKKSVNVVTKRGTNDFHGNVFGFLRDKKIQAHNPFAPFKTAFTRTQSGATFGGRIIRDKTFFFTAFERRQRNESGFFTSDVAQGLGGSATIGVIPGLNPLSRTFSNITPQQASFINNAVTQGLALIGAGQTANGSALICLARTYGFFASSGGQTALTGNNTQFTPNDGSGCPAITPITGGAIGSRFLLSGAPVPIGTTNAAGQPIAFRALNNLQRVFPITDRANFFSIRGDHNFNENNQFEARFGYNPGRLTGLRRPRRERLLPTVSASLAASLFRA